MTPYRATFWNMNGFGTFEVTVALVLLAIPGVLVVWSMWATGAFRRVPH
jgi:hypothetical protein